MPNAGGISGSGSRRLRARYVGIGVDDAKRPKELEAENAPLKRLLADAAVEEAAVKDVAKGKWRARVPSGLPRIVWCIQESWARSLLTRGWVCGPKSRGVLTAVQG